MLSHDIEDIVSVLDGRPEILDEIEIADTVAWKSKMKLKSFFIVKAIERSASAADSLA